MAEMPPLVRMLFEPECGHHLAQQNSSSMPDRRGRQRLVIRLIPVVIRFGDYTDRIDGSSHVKRRPIGCRCKGQVDCSPGAVGRWCRRIITRWCPETANIGHYMLQSLGLGWIQAIHTTAIALLADGMGHHVGLNGNGPPGIENSKAELRMTGLQLALSAEQPCNHSGTETKGVCPCSIGSTDADVGVRLQSQQGIRQRFQGFLTIHDQPITPRPHIQWRRVNPS